MCYRDTKLLWLGWLPSCAQPWLGLAWARLACLASNNNRRPAAASLDHPGTPVASWAIFPLEASGYLLYMSIKMICSLQVARGHRSGRCYFCLTELQSAPDNSSCDGIFVLGTGNRLGPWGFNSWDLRFVSLRRVPIDFEPLKPAPLDFGHSDWGLDPWRFSPCVLRP